MKKFLQSIYSYKEIEVIDTATLCKELAVYHMILGFSVFIKYKTIQ